MDIDEYQSHLQNLVNDSRELANQARSHQDDPKPFVEMEFAENIAERCEKLLRIDGLADRIIAFQEDGLEREEIAIAVADEFSNGNIGSYESKESMIDAAIRTAVALLTEGVVAAPIDGIGDITLDTNSDGSQFIRIPYYGPIRSAGGTGQALSVLVADYIRQQLDIGEFNPTDNEVERYIEEIQVYDTETSLQYVPSDEDIRNIVKNTSVMLDGVQTTQREVEGFRDLDRIEGNRARGGMCLVLAEGIAQKAPKIQKYTSQMDIDGWGWLEELKTANTSSDSDDEQTENISREDRLKSLKPKDKFVSDLIGGRPVFSESQRAGGFRLRYGRARNTGLAACGYNPAMMILVDEFIATGTQLKTERPGKAAGVAPVDSIEGPTVRLESGELLRIDDVETAYEHKDHVTEIFDLGEVAIPYGEFLENNHPLAPASYVYEWWIQELDSALETDIETAFAGTLEDISSKKAFELAQMHDIPLHPRYTYYWDDVTTTQYQSFETPLEVYNALAESIEQQQQQNQNQNQNQSNIKFIPDTYRPTLEELLIPHRWDQETQRCYFDDADVSRVVEHCFSTSATGESVRERAESAAGVVIRERAPLRIGARMGRPEKSKRRVMNPPVHTLFAVGDHGGRGRDILQAAIHEEEPNTLDDTNSKDENNSGVLKTQLAYRYCESCDEETWRPNCAQCGEQTVTQYSCPRCGRDGEQGIQCPSCEIEFQPYKNQEINIDHELTQAIKDLNLRGKELDPIKADEFLSSSSKIPEPLHKGILRSKYGLDVFRDGTTRYDTMDLPLTSFSGDDIDLSVDELYELGYTQTLDGDKLTDTTELVELFPQDMILSADAGNYLLKVSQFIDELLEKYYDCDPYYNATKITDLIGEGLLGLAPHTSAGVLARVIGFTDSATNLASPFYHAGKRRNADGDEDSVMLLMDGLLNFSREYLPTTRGKSTMDSPLVVSTVINPAGVDDEAHNVDISSQYPLEFYNKSYEIVDPKEVDIAIAEDITDTGLGFKHTLETSSIDAGPSESAYKHIDGMDAKTFSQLSLAEKLRPVNEHRIAEMVIQKHFLPDIIGNLTAFGRQQTRCYVCGEKYRRVPVDGSCHNCGTGVILTVHEGSVKKYLNLVDEIVTRYEISEYTKQRIKLLSERIESLFEDDTNKQSDITDFF
jgi:DNA polymerase II large subunit